MTSDAIRQAYGSVAELYISLFATDKPAFVGQHLGGVRGRVLDLGCGPGHLTAYLRSLGVDAAGIDLVPEFIAHARAAHPEVDFRVGSMETLDAADHSVAGILAWFSLIHLPPPAVDGVLREFRRALAPGGTLVAGIFTGDEAGPFDHKVATAYRWPADEFAARLTAAGFVETDRVRWVAEGTGRPLAAIAAR
ncbi:class I SAM-dependent methyltransferase [Actinoplanes sp. CA-142083]|uniref:class I SAM-dependent methyltransferase n=1 Tax=Actinoplanes sp. CA-142083 TaxID=3239903 RepID=UPI003D89F414